MGENMIRITRSSGKEPAAVRSMCIVCGVEFIKAPILREGENFSELWNQMWTAFCISLDLNPSSWTGISSFYSQFKEVPFCDAGECRMEVVKLLVLRNQIEGIEEKISKITNNILMTIINTHTSTRSWNFSESQEIQSEDQNVISDLSVKTQIEKLRKRLTHRFIPNVILTNIELEGKKMDEQEEMKSTTSQEGEGESENEAESNFIDYDSESEPETEPETELETESEPEVEPEVQSSAPVNINIKNTEDSDSIWMYQEKWPISPVVKSLGQPGLNKPASKTRFKCLTCGRTRMGKGNITTHIRQDHISPNRFVCSICGQRSRDSVVLRQHMKVHGAESVSQISTRASRASTSASTSLSIQRKNKRNPDSNKFWLYMNVPIIRYGSQSRQKNSNKFKCGICDYSSSIQTCVMRHVQRIHTSPDKFVCLVCGENNADDWCLRAHMKIHGDSSSAVIQTRREIEKKSPSPSASPSDTGCNLILVKGKWPVERIGNIQNRDNKNVYRCKTCGFTGRGMQGITTHINRMHIGHKNSIKSAVDKKMEKHGKTSSTGNKNNSERGLSTYLRRNQRRKSTSSESSTNNNGLLVPY